MEYVHTRYTFTYKILRRSMQILHIYYTERYPGVRLLLRCIRRSTIMEMPKMMVATTIMMDNTSSLSLRRRSSHT